MLDLRGVFSLTDLLRNHKELVKRPGSASYSGSTREFLKRDVRAEAGEGASIFTGRRGASIVRAVASLDGGFF